MSVAAHIPEHQAFATKPTIAAKLIADALDAGVPCAWILADALHGSDSKLRRMLEGRGHPYCLAVRPNHCLRFVRGEHFEQTDPETMAAELDAGAGQVMQPEKVPRVFGSMIGHVFHRALVRMDNGSAGFSSVAAVAILKRAPITLSSRLPEQSSAKMAGAAGLRWTVEECFQRPKGDLGLGHCEARSWHGWNRHMTLVMAAAAFLAKLGADLRRAAGRKPNERSRNPPIAA